MRTWGHASLIFLFVFVGSSASAQQATGSQDPQAVSILQKSLASLIGTTTVTDVTLTGTVNRTAGSDIESGTVILRATAVGQSRMDLTLPAGNRSEARDDSQSPPVGQWLAPGGSVQPIAQHNLLTEPAWFYPSFVLARVLSNSAYSISSMDQESKNGSSVDHITVSQQSPVPAGTQDWLTTLSRMDVYLDATSFLPVAVDLNTHPDDNAALNIPIEIQFSDYQAIQGLQVPMRVLQLVNNSVLLDIEVTQASFNTGLTSTVFSLQ